MKSLPQEFLDLLSRHGRDLLELGIDGIALPRRAALDAVETLQRAGCVPILGGEVFQVRNGKLAHSYDSWDCKSGGNPNSDQYLNDSLKQAKAYIQRYSDPEDGSVFYQIVVPKPWHIRAPR